MSKMVTESTINAFFIVQLPKMMSVGYDYTMSRNRLTNMRKQKRPESMPGPAGFLKRKTATTRFIGILLLIMTAWCSSDLRDTRPFHMAAAPFRFLVSDTDISTDFDFKGFAGRVEAISLHMDNFFGLPWIEFAGGSALPASWVSRMSSIRENVRRLNIPVYLSLTPLNAMRNGLAASAVDKNGALVVTDAWLSGCVDFYGHPDAQLIETAYLRYVDWMIEFFDPVYLTHGIEVNLYARTCPARYDSLIYLLNRVYSEVKTAHPDLIVFPSFTLADLYGYGDHGDCDVGHLTCLEDNIRRQQHLERDRFGISTYPIFLQWEWERIPDDFLTAIHRLTGERCVIAETGQGCYDVTIPWPSADDPCFTMLRSSHADQKAYMQFLFDSAVEMDCDLVVWWSLKDYLFESILTYCPCSAPGLWCVLYRAVQKTGLLGAWLMWGSMGILDYRGNEKPVAGLWTDWLRKERTGRN